MDIPLGIKVIPLIILTNTQPPKRINVLILNKLDTQFIIYTISF